MEFLERYNELTKALLQSSLATTNNDQMLLIEAIVSAIYTHIAKKSEQHNLTPQAVLAIVYSLTMSVTEIMIEHLNEEDVLTEEESKKIDDIIKDYKGDTL